VSEHHPLIERYVSRLSEGLQRLAPEERQEVLQEIRNHIADAMAAGKSLDAVIESLGPADVLARGYAAELMLHPRREVRSTFARRFLALTGLVVVGSIPSLVIVVTLGSVGVSLTVAGVAVFCAGISAVAGVLPGWVQMDVPPSWAIAIGPVLAVIGALAIVGLVWYVRFMARMIRAVLPAST
jgi:uncharacterized membrane protein